MAQQKSKIPLAVGLTAAAGVGYYLFQAGGNPTVAEKKFEGESLVSLSQPNAPRPRIHREMPPEQR